MEKYMRARKEYPCDHCKQIIKKGELYLLDKGRAPRYSSDGSYIQIGINYYQYRLCLKEGCHDS